MATIIIFGVIILIGVGIKIYLHNVLKQFDGTGKIHSGQIKNDEIHLSLFDENKL